MLLSPILNAASSHLNVRSHACAVAVLLAATVWFGNKWDVYAFGANGFSTIQFVFLYLVGSLLRRCATSDGMQRHRRHFLWIFVGSALLWGVFTMLKAYRSDVWLHVPQWHPFCYNNLLVVMAAVGLFLFVMSFRFYSPRINNVARSVLGVYIIQESIFRYRWVSGLAHSYPPAVMLAIMLAMSVLFLVVALSVDRIRLWFTSWIMSLYDRFVTPTIARLEKWIVNTMEDVLINIKR